VIERLRFERARSRLIGEHNIQPVRLEVTHEWTYFSLPTNHVDRRLKAKCGSENLKRNQFRKGVGETDVDSHRMLSRALFHRIHQFAASRENLISVVEHKLACFGENKISSTAPKKLLPE